MRVGINPEKVRGEKNILKQHRVVVIFYIPNIYEEYYKESLSILDYCLNSLIRTINFDTTCITLINNNSCSEVNPIINKYIGNNNIDKYVRFDENKGKVYAAMTEIRGIYEKFVTITDADVLFLNGWEGEVFNIFRDFPKAGVVSPIPGQGLAFNHNNSVFFDNFFKSKIKYSKLVSDYDCDLFSESLGNKAILNRNNHKYSWKDKQYYLSNKIKAVIGAPHFVATYRSNIFKNISKFPKMKFKNGYEDFYLDKPADIKGLYRLSTTKCNAYHMGNRVDLFIKNVKFNKIDFIDASLFNKIGQPRESIAPYRVREFFFKIIKRIFRL